MQTSYIYMLTNSHRTVFYVGVTKDLDTRMKYHREGKGSVFCKRYSVNILIYFEVFTDLNDAIHRETVLKRWKREWKIDLIRKKNPGMTAYMDYLGG